MKRFSVLLLSVLFAIALFACGDSETAPTLPAIPSMEPSSETDPTGTETPTTAAFFGKEMDSSIAAVNEKTYANPSSGLYDVLHPTSLTNADLVSLIASYTLPATVYYDGMEDIYTPGLSILANTNQELLWASPEQPVEPKFGILTTNASVRSYPTAVKATNELSDYAFDYFQETKLNFATGVLVYHSSADGAYYFCQGENYYGWIRVEDIALTDWETFSNFLAPDEFIVSIGDYSQEEPWYRTGVILPLIDSKNHAAVKPYRDRDGFLKLGQLIYPTDVFHEGFLSYSPQAVVDTASFLLGCPYGWADTDNYYDCSSYAGLVYRCFGFYMPRNSSIMNAFGGRVIDVQGMSKSEKQALLKAHNGAILLCPGHVLLSVNTENGLGVYHELSACYNESGERTEYYSCQYMLADDIYFQSGESLWDRILYVLYY